MKIVITSGYFDPLHVGHLECFKLAKELGDRLLVIINSDKQSKLKKGYYFMNEQDRFKIITSLIYVNDAMVSIDKDQTQCETLKFLAKYYKGMELIFAKGGDRNRKNIPEAKICKKYGIKIVDGLGKKIRSSSEIVKKAKHLNNI